MKKFSFIITLIFIALTIIIETVNYLIIQNPETIKWLRISNIFYFILTLILFFITSFGIKAHNNKIFVKTLGTSMILRLLFTLSFIAIALIISDIGKMQFVIGNILLYFIYMAFEIKFLAFNLRLDSETRQR
ncbi:MAG: hypothetical protein M0R38_01640 [Bacteroidia bacterium]|nr:hypothetical protein [Bacteroidia bacterium]